ncbi:single-stranded DNA-binding protein [Cryobacterium sp. CG_9.6]|uniref:single-stranded DNA-binding protein n=1 Tax=Cryobacterium sp. CG_9.6 TaxID=2760710 RepID=UPI0024772CCC|nr:single-stranded DNA-binding protein [Cryobacterium sp. CG_9.6]MDH6237429.1 single-strand DNA-binding protein [Cryobacterium sp. CG_9.6]
MYDTITLLGVIATEPQHQVKSGLPITSFRLASGQSRFDRATQSWVQSETNWYSVSTYRQLALNTRLSLYKGEHIVIVGRLKVHEWSKGDRSGTSIDVDADALGPDLTWCTTNSVRTAVQRTPVERTTVSTPPREALGPGQQPGQQQSEHLVTAPNGVGDGFLPSDEAGSFDRLAALDS